MEIDYSVEDLRKFEEKISQLYADTKIRAPIHLSGGNEDQLFEIFGNIRENDWVFASYRGHFHALLKGMSSEWLEKEIIEGRSMHICSPEHKYYSSCIASGQLPIALGTALALKLKGSEDHVWAFCGDMAAETGTFHEVTKYAEGHNLPITFVVEDDGYGVYTSTKDSWGNSAFSSRSHSFNLVERNSGVEEISPSIFRYSYDRIWDHHGIGLFIDFPDDVNPNPEPEYKENVRSAMKILGEDQRTIFIGQTVGVRGSPVYGTLEDVVDPQKRIELPIMEETQMGMSIGLSLEGYIPISIYPRWDFLILATNQLVNHLDKMEEFSQGRYKPKVIIKTMIGSQYPLYPGPQHIQDHTESFRKMLTNIDVVKLDKAKDVLPVYKKALQSEKSTLIVEHVDLYRP